MGFFKTRRPILAAGTEITTPDAASQVEAEAGVEAALRSFSPLRIAQAIAALGGGGFSGARLNVANQSITQDVNTNLDFTSTEEYDDGAWYDNGVSATNVIVPAGVTRVLMTGEVTWQGLSGTSRRLILEVNGANKGEVHFHPSLSTGFDMQVTTVVDVAADDVLTLAVFQDSVSSLNVTQGNFTVTALG